jgi:type IV secretory pathway VirB2 component (pilin)
MTQLRTRLRTVRMFTWIIVAVNVVFAAFMVNAIASGWTAQGECAARRVGCPDQGVGAVLGGWGILAAWVAVDVVMGLMWWFGRPKAAT